MVRSKVVFYTDELNDEFSEKKITPRVIDENYKYERKGIFNKISHFFWYRIIATPIAFIYDKLVFHTKIVNKKVLKPYKKQGYFLYGNHTQSAFDAYNPSMICFPKKDFKIVNPENVSIKGLGNITQKMGAIPLPSNIKAYRNFMESVRLKIQRKQVVVIYPEAHIWPYYTKIRPFKNVSFAYPVDLDAPTFSFTNTYQRRKLFKNKVKIVTYIDGPFFADKNLSKTEQKKQLRDMVYRAMRERSLESNFEKIKYIKGEKTNG